MVGERQAKYKINEIKGLNGGCWRDNTEWWNCETFAGVLLL